MLSKYLIYLNSHLRDHSVYSNNDEAEVWKVIGGWRKHIYSDLLLILHLFTATGPTESKCIYFKGIPWDSCIFPDFLWSYGEVGYKMFLSKYVIVFKDPSTLTGKDMSGSNVQSTRLCQSWHTCMAWGPVVGLCIRSCISKKQAPMTESPFCWQDSQPWGPHTARIEIHAWWSSQSWLHVGQDSWSRLCGMQSWPIAPSYGGMFRLS